MLEVRRDFYPRPHMEGDIYGWRNLLSAGISTHALTWRATIAKSIESITNSNFYPRPHMEGDTPTKAQQPITADISTHALTWRATWLSLPPDQDMEISTHALTWRATREVSLDP